MIQFQEIDEEFKVFEFLRMIQILVVIIVLEFFFCYIVFEFFFCYIVFGSYGFCFDLWTVVAWRESNHFVL